MKSNAVRVRVSVVAVTVCLLSGCSGNHDTDTVVPAWVSEHENSLHDLLAQFYRQHSGGYDADAVAREVRHIAGLARSRMDSGAESTTSAIARAVLEDRAVAYRSIETDIVFRPDDVLRGGAGCCLGLCTVVLLVAEELGVPAYAIVRPYPLHAVVSIAGTVVDLVHHGRRVAHTDLVLWSGVGIARRYGSPLSNTQLFGLHAVSLAGARLRGEQDLSSMTDRRVWDLYRLALSIDRNDAEAWFGTALEAYSKGRRTGALAKVRRSLQLNPLAPAALLFKAQLERLAGDTGQSRLDRRRAESILAGEEGGTETSRVPLPDR